MGFRPLPAGGKKRISKSKKKKNSFPELHLDPLVEQSASIEKIGSSQFSFSLWSIRDRMYVKIEPTLFSMECATLPSPTQIIAPLSLSQSLGPLLSLGKWEEKKEHKE